MGKTEIRFAKTHQKTCRSNVLAQEIGIAFNFISI